MGPSLIFVTGGTGFIGSRVVLDALKAGHRLRLSVRRGTQVEELKARFSQYASQLEFSVVPNLSDVNAIRAAFAGSDVEYILHIASPMPGKADDFKTEYLEPAVQGTEAILTAAAATPSIKRVVITSSVLSLLPVGETNTPGLKVKTGTNPSIPVNEDMAFPEGPAGYGVKYAASKVLAHRATINWVAAHRPHFSVVTVHPTFVLGRDLTQCDADSPNGINAYLLKSLTNPPGGKPIVPASFVDVRDVSLVILKSLDVELSKEELVTEYLAVGGPTTYDEVVRFVNNKYPEVDVKLEGPFDAPLTADTIQTEKALGIKWRGIEEIIGSVLDQQRELRGGEGKTVL